MVVGDTIGGGVGLSEVPPPEATDVRHFDQLSHREQRAFLQLYRGTEPATVPFSGGEVVVFTDYYRVEH